MVSLQTLEYAVDTFPARFIRPTYNVVLNLVCAGPARTAVCGVKGSERQRRRI